MSAEFAKRLLTLIGELLDGELSADESAELNALLKSDAEARSIYREHMELHARLHLDYTGVQPNMPGERMRTPQTRPVRWGLWTAIAAALLIGGLLLRSPQTSVATLISSEDAAWESALPTLPGSPLDRGLMVLKTGVATIRFNSGAEVVLEAPAELRLKSAMRGELLSGAAVIDVPESAIGFVIDTPNGYVVDHGTKFAVMVGDARESFAVISGEISVHHPDSGGELRLLEDETSTMTTNGVLPSQDQELAKPTGPTQRRSRIGTMGRATSIIRNRDLSHLRPDMLLLKTGFDGGDFDRRAIIGFDISEEDIRQAAGARLRLTLVPSGMGFAAHLPRQNRFALYGITNEGAEHWEVGCHWDEAPGLDDGKLLARFQIPRSRQRGVIWVKSAAILEFLQADSDGAVTMLLVRESDEEGRHGLVHAFANDAHAEASGPMLELNFTP